MAQEIQTIRLSLPLSMGSVNCFLVKTDNDYFLIDTGISNQRPDLEKELEKAGCTPGMLKLIVITHGDFDHIGNAAYLREKFGSKIAMHADDVGMAEHGDMFWNRKKGSFFMRKLVPIFFGLDKKNRFKSDINIEEGSDLTEYGFDARVLSIPGHSKGSVGILTGDGDLFCGDLFSNNDKPAFSSIMDDFDLAKGSLEKLKSFSIKKVYPGHGNPFQMEALIKEYQ